MITLDVRLDDKIELSVGRFYVILVTRKRLYEAQPLWVNFDYGLTIQFSIMRWLVELGW